VSVGLPAGAVVDAVGLALDGAPVEAAQVVAGAPQTGFAVLDESGGGELGVWEMTPGAMSDVEADETFVVLSGSATVEFTDPPLPPIDLRAGSVVRLEAGMRTTWTVHETLRKVYLAP
jgi:uncharacterized protein